MKKISQMSLIGLSLLALSSQHVAVALPDCLNLCNPFAKKSSTLVPQDDPDAVKSTSRTFTETDVKKQKKKAFWQGFSVAAVPAAFVIVGSGLLIWHKEAVGAFLAGISDGGSPEFSGFSNDTIASNGTEEYTSAPGYTTDRTSHGMNGTELIAYFYENNCPDLSGKFTELCTKLTDWFSGSTTESTPIANCTLQDNIIAAQNSTITSQKQRLLSLTTSRGYWQTNATDCQNTLNTTTQNLKAWVEKHATLNGELYDCKNNLRDCKNNLYACNPNSF